MQKKLLLISMMLIVLCSLSAVSASEINGTDDAIGVDSDVSAPCDIVSASEINGTDEVDSGDLLSAPSTSTVTVSTWSDLKSACTNTTQYDTIYVSGGITPPNSIGKISISKSVTIEGLSGSYIGGTSTDNAVSVGYVPFYTTTNGLNITFKNLNFQNIKNNILIHLNGNGNYVFENCNFDNIVATAWKQSIIWLNYGTGNITNCNFTNNKLSFGTITNFYSSSSSTVNNARMSISDCRFTNNQGSYAPGAINNCGYMDIQNTIFENNRATNWAGAVLSYTYATTNINNTTFKNNKAGWNGGAIYTYSILNISNSTFEGNNCSTNTGGGAIGATSYGSTYNITINNCTFKNNRNLNSNGYGGAIAAMDAGYFHLYYSTFINNTATTGKAIAVREGEYIHSGLENDTNASVILGNPVFGIAHNIFVDVDAHTNDANIAYISNNASYIAAHNNTFYTPSEYANRGNNQQSSIFTDELLGLSLDDVELVGDSQDTPQWAMDGFDSSNSQESPYAGISNGVIAWNYTGNVFSSLSIDKDGRIILVNNGHLLYLYTNGTVYAEPLIALDDGSISPSRFFSIENYSISPNNYFTIITEDNGNYLLNFAETDKSISSSGTTTYLGFKKWADTMPVNNVPLFVDKNDGKVHFLCFFPDDLLVMFDFNEIIRDPYSEPYEGYGLISSTRTPTVTESGIWVPTSDGIVVFDLKNFGEEAAPIKTISASVSSRPVADANGNVYFFTSDSISKADSTNGVTKTQAVTGGTGSRMAISSLNNALYSVNSIGTLYKYSLDDLTESEVYDIGTPASTIMTDASGVIYVGTTDGKFYAISDAGDELWSVDTESGSEVKNCAMDNEGNIYFYTAENKVYAINEAPLADANLTFKVDEKFNTTDDITFTANINSTLDGQNITFTVTGTDNDYKNSTNATIGDGVATWDIGKLPAGNYKVEAKYVSDGTFADANVENTFEVTKVTPELSVNINNATVFENATITVTSSNCEGNVTVKVGDKYTFENVTIGEEFTLPLLPADIYDVTVTYKEDSTYAGAVNDTEKLEISKVTPELSVNINNGTVFENASITVTSSNCEGNVTVKVGDKYTYENVVIGEEFTLPLLPIGVYDVVVTYAEDANYTGAVNDTEQLEITKEEPMIEPYVSDDGSTVILSFDGKESGIVYLDVADFGYYATIEKGEAEFNIGGLEPGNYTATVTYPGDENYKNTTFDINIEVPELLDPELEVAVNGTEVTVSLSDLASGYVLVSVGNDDFFFEYEGGPIVVDLATYLEPGNYTVDVTYSGDDYFASANDTVKVTVPEVVPLDPKLKVGVDGTVVTVSLSDLASGYVLVSVGNDDFFFEYKGEPIVVDLADLKPGNYTVDVTYSGDDYFASANDTVKVTVPEVVPLDPKLKVGVDGTVVTVTLDELASGYVVVSVGDESLYFEYGGGPIVVDFSDLEPGNYTVDVTYSGDDYFASDSASAKLTVPKVEPKDSELKVDIKNTIITVTINENATGDVIITVGDISFIQDASELAPIDVSNYLTNGTYPVTVEYVGDDVFAEKTLIGGKVTVPEEPVIEPKDPNLKATATNATIAVTVDKDATGYVLVDVDGQGYYASIKNGQATVNVIGLEEGKYQATVTYVGDDVFKAASATVTVTVPSSGKNDTPVDPKADISISEDGVDITLPKDATGYLLVDVDGEGYYTPVKDGKASLDLPELAPGNHTVTVTYTGDKKYDQANATKTITVENPIETIISENLTKVEKSADRFEAVFTDAEGNPLANTDVQFIILGKTYTRTTDASGKAGMNINLPAGNYSVTVINPVTNETKVNTITVLPRIESSDLVKYFKNASQFLVKVLDDEGNPVKAGEVVTFNINGVFYNRTTDSNGYAKLSINLGAGNYTITSEYKGCKAANNIEVLPILFAKDLTKQYDKKAAFEATLVDGQGKAYANQQVEFNINGVFYKRTTDNNGVARLNINLPVGKYIVTSSFNGFNIANNVTVTA